MCDYDSAIVSLAFATCPINHGSGAKKTKKKPKTVIVFFPPLFFLWSQVRRVTMDRKDRKVWRVSADQKDLEGLKVSGIKG